MQNYMQDILDKWEESGISVGEMARRADLGESTVRRLKGGGNTTYGTLCGKYKSLWKKNKIVANFPK